MCLTIRFILRALPEAIEEMDIISDRFFLREQNFNKKKLNLIFFHCDDLLNFFST